MSATDGYQLLDFGAGRKLERFGAHVLDRPAPAAAGARMQQSEMWAQADARYDRTGDDGRWSLENGIESPWRLRLDGATLELKLTDFGHLGLFPEQIENWNWINRQIRAANRPIKVLNLFAYTGGSTLAAAAAGAQVTHVDAAANVVAWARRNAVISDLAAAPIRWIVEDAAKFVRRELKRGNRYDAVILDPPSYGHGPHGEVWKLDEHLPELLGMCLELTADNRQFLLLSCHSGELGTAAGLSKYAKIHAPEVHNENSWQASEMSLLSTDRQRLHCGAAARWCALASAGSEESPTKNQHQRNDWAARQR